MDVPLGLHPGVYAPHQHPVVQHHELPGHCGVPVWYGGHDHAEDTAQGHCQIQPDGQHGQCNTLLLQIKAPYVEPPSKSGHLGVCGYSGSVQSASSVHQQITHFRSKPRTPK